MTQVFLISGVDTSPWSKPGDWTDSGHTVELIGPGGDGGGSPTTGTNHRSGAGGGGGAYLKLTYSSGALGSTTAFQVGAGNSLTSYNVSSSTVWQGTTATNSHEAKAGLKGADSAATAGAGGAGVTNGSPSPVTYTVTTNNSGGGGGAVAAVAASGGGGGGAGGPSGVGGDGGPCITGGRGGGGGGAANGGGSAGSTSASATGTSGAGTGGGAGGASGAGSNATGTTGAGGGGGFFSSSSGTDSHAGNGINSQTFDSTHGLGGGGGGGGGNSNTGSGANSSGGTGANYGGGGGAAGGCRSTTSTRTAGTGGDGLIVINYTAGANTPQSVTALLDALSPTVRTTPIAKKLSPRATALPTLKPRTITRKISNAPMLLLPTVRKALVKTVTSALFKALPSALTSKSFAPSPPSGTYGSIMGAAIFGTASMGTTTYAAGAAPVDYPQSVSTSVKALVTATKNVGKRLTAASMLLTVPLVRKAVGKILSAAPLKAMPPSIRRAVAKILSAAPLKVGPPTVKKAATKRVTNAPMLVMPPTVRKAAGKIVTFAPLKVGPPTVRRAAGKTVSARATGLPTVKKAVTHRVTNALLSVLPPSVRKAVAKSITGARATALPSVRKAVGKRITGARITFLTTVGTFFAKGQTIIVALKVGPPTVRKAVTHRVNALVLLLVSARKAVTFRLTLALFKALPTVRKNVGKRVSTLVLLLTSTVRLFSVSQHVTALMKAMPPSIRRAVSFHVSPRATALPSVRRAAAHTVSVRATGLPTVRKAVSYRVIAAAAKAISTTRENVGKRVTALFKAGPPTVSRLIVRAQTVVAHILALPTVRKAVGKTVSPRATALPSMRRAVAKRVTALFDAVVSVAAETLGHFVQTIMVAVKAVPTVRKSITFRVTGALIRLVPTMRKGRAQTVHALLSLTVSRRKAVGKRLLPPLKMTVTIPRPSRLKILTPHITLVVSKVSRSISFHIRPLIDVIVTRVQRFMCETETASGTVVQDEQLTVFTEALETSSAWSEDDETADPWSIADEEEDQFVERPNQPEPECCED